MEPTEQEYAEEFGIEPEEQPEDGTSTENGPVSAEEAGEGQGTGEDGGEPERAQEPPAGADTAAEARQRQQQEAARQAQEQEISRAAEQTRRDQIFAEMFAGQMSPYTGKPITTEAEYRAYQAERARREREQQLQKAGIAPEHIKGMIDQELAPVRQQLQQAQMAAARERTRAVEAQAQEVIGAAVKNITAIFPEVKSLEDIAAMPTAEAFNGYVQKGLSLEDAFYLANRKAIEDKKLTAARTAALRGAANRGHLDPVPAGGTAAPVEVPADMRASYLEIMPGATDAEISNAYAKYLKDLK